MGNDVYLNSSQTKETRLHVGALVDARHPTTGEWLKSKICGRDDDMQALVSQQAFTREELKPTGRVKVHYIGWAARHDEWYDKEQQCVNLAPPGSRTGHESVHPSRRKRLIRSTAPSFDRPGEFVVSILTDGEALCVDKCKFTYISCAIPSGLEPDIVPRSCGGKVSIVGQGFLHNQQTRVRLCPLASPAIRKPGGRRRSSTNVALQKRLPIEGRARLAWKQKYFGVRLTCCPVPAMTMLTSILK